jgi:hypothetical protein
MLDGLAPESPKAGRAELYSTVTENTYPDVQFGQASDRDGLQRWIEQTAADRVPPSLASAGHVFVRYC